MNDIINPYQFIIQKLTAIETMLHNNTTTKTESSSKLEIISRQELANRLGISTRTIINLEKSKRIKCIKIGRLRKYVFSEVLNSMSK